MHTYTVELPRTAEFPLDMLRYDDANAATRDDQDLIDLLKDLGSEGRDALDKRVRITLRSPDRFAPHVKRWNSFGVDVVASDNPYTAPSELMLSAQATRYATLSVTKRAGDAYDVHDGQKRIAAIRGYEGGWTVRWEGPGENPAPGRFFDAHRAVQELVALVLK